MTAEAAERPEATLGLCFVFDYNALVRAATDEHVSWHEWLLQEDSSRSVERALK